MKLVRLAFAALFLACTSNEAQLDAAKASLEKQVAARSEYLKTREEISRYRSELRAWTEIANNEAENRPFVPRPPQALSKPPPAPLVVPELSPARGIDSSVAQGLRAQIAALVSQARKLDRDISDLELFKSIVRHELERAQKLDLQIAVNVQKDPLRLSEIARPSVAPDAGLMRRISE